MPFREHTCHIGVADIYKDVIEATIHKQKMI